MNLQEQLLEAQTNLCNRRKTSCQEEYIRSGTHNAMGSQEAFDNLEQATAEDCAAVINLTIENSNLSYKVALYTNRLCTKEADNEALHTSVRNLQVEVKNIKADVDTLKSSSHCGGGGDTKKYRY